MRTVSLVAIFIWGSASVSLAAPTYSPSPTSTPISGSTSTGTDIYSPTPTPTTRPKPMPLSGTELFPRDSGEAQLGPTTVFWPYENVGGVDREGGLAPVGDVLRDMAGLGSQPMLVSSTTASVETGVWGPMHVVPSAGVGVARGKGIEGRVAVVATVLGGLGSIMLCVTACGALVRARACGWGKGDGGDLRFLTKEQGAGLKADDRVLDIRRTDKELFAGSRVSDLSVYSATSHYGGHGLGGRARISVAAPVPPGRASAMLLSAGEFFTLPSTVSSLMVLGHVRMRSAPEERGRGCEVFGHRRVASSGSVGETEGDVQQGFRK